MVGLFLVCSAGHILAQTQVELQRQRLLQPPPPLTFANPKEVESDEYTRVLDLSFPSALDSPYPENNTVRLKVFLPTDTTRPVASVVILHYWGATELSLESALARELNTHGIAGIVMTLPYHLSRTPKGTRSGELALQPDPEKLVATMTQAILDLRRTVDWMVSRGEFDKERIGVAGTSLGGIVASLGFGIEPRFKAGSFVLAGADLAGILWSSSRVVAQREELRRRGYSEERLRQELAAIEPSAYLRTDDPRRTLVIAADHDTVVLPEYARRLISALASPSVLWLPTGHFGGALARGRIVRTVSRFFDAYAQGSAFQPPSSIPALTLWFGLVVTPERGLQVSVSTDVWRARKDGDTFVAAVVTPQGFEAFLGQRISNGLSFGVALLPRKPTVGALWRVAF